MTWITPIGILLVLLGQTLGVSQQLRRVLKTGKLTCSCEMAPSDAARPVQVEVADVADATAPPPEPIEMNDRWTQERKVKIKFIRIQHIKHLIPTT